MSEKHFRELLLNGGDLRSKGKSDEVAAEVRNQDEFDALFSLLFSSNRVLRMRAADAAEKISVRYPEFLDCHREELLQVAESAGDKELQWHLAQMMGRARFRSLQKSRALTLLMKWLLGGSASAIVKVCALQAVFELDGTKGKTFRRAIQFASSNKSSALRARARILIENSIH